MSESRAMKILFTGSDNVGRSHTMLTVAHILSRLRKEVLVLDFSSSQGVFNYFEIGEDESNLSLTNLEPLTRNSFTFLCNNPNVYEDEETDLGKILDEIDEDDFDFILIETDKYTAKDLAYYVDKVYLVVDADRNHIQQGASILSTMEDCYDKVNLVFNNIPVLSYDKHFILTQIIESTPKSMTFLEQEEIILPFSANNINQCLENKMEGSFDIMLYTNEFKSGIFTLMETFMNISKAQFSAITSRGGKK